jgi:hypothetical protein
MRRVACLSLFGLLLATSAVALVPPLPEERPPQTVVFRPYQDRTQGAFTLLVCRGWQVKGGVTRQPGSSRTRIDVTVRRGPGGEVMVRWYPRLKFHDPGNGDRSRPRGTVRRPLSDPHAFNLEFLLPRLHPRAVILRRYPAQKLPGLARVFAQTSAHRDRATFQAGRTIVTYREGGRVYYEVIITVIRAIRPAGGRTGVLWDNPATLIVRTPLRRINKWQGVLAETLRSFRPTRRWLARRGRRGRSIDRLMAGHQSRIDALVRQYMYRYRTFQGAYVNPYTRRVEIGSVLWRVRWVSPGGRVIYTNDRGYDPNRDRQLPGRRWKRSAARKARAR